MQIATVLDEVEVEVSPRVATRTDPDNGFGVPVSTVHYWAAAKKGPPSFQVEKHRRWAVSDVVAHIEAQRAAARG